MQIPGVGKFQANSRSTNTLKKRALFIIKADMVRPQWRVESKRIIAERSTGDG